MTAFGEQGDLFDAIDNRSLWESFREGEFDLSRQVFMVVAFQADGLDIIPGKAELDAAADIVELERGRVGMSQCDEKIIVECLGNTVLLRRKRRRH